MFNSKKNIILLIALVCIAPVFVSGCAFQRKEGGNYAALRLKGEITLFGGDSTETTVTTDKGLQTLQDSKKPSFEQKQIIQKAIDNPDQQLIKNAQEILGY